jgi:4-aminobutyrate aminotransferase-like enzyme/Ser/Thr protein kinase RdoA (MazF antagonist)
LLGLRTTSSAVSTAEAGEAVREIYGLEASLSPLSGERDRNFRFTLADGSDAVLKILDSAADALTVDCQVRVLRHLAERDPSLPVPRLRFTSAGLTSGILQYEGETHATLLVSFLPGRLLSEIRPDRVLLEEFGRTLGRLDRALQGFFHPSLGQALVWDLRRLPELAQSVGTLPDEGARRAVREVLKGVEARLAALYALPSQAIHGDCHGANVLVDQEAGRIAGLVDFGDMIHAPRVFEPGVAIAELLGEGVAACDDVPALIAGYVLTRPLEAGEVAALYDVVVARQAVCLLVHEWRLRHDPAGTLATQSTVQHGVGSLEALLSIGRDALTSAWHCAAGTAATVMVASSAMVASTTTAASTLFAEATQPTAAGEGATCSGTSRLLRRRARLLGSGAELFYERPLHLVRGEDVWLFDADGRRYLDVYNNVPHVGHAHPHVVAAIQRQTATLATHTRYLHEAILDYAEALTRRLPAHLDTCIFVNSGSEANDVAWRIAQAATGRRGAVILEHAYHGITDAVAALTPAAGQPEDPRIVTLGAPPARLTAGDTPSAAELLAAEADVERALATLAQRGFAPAAWYLDTGLTSCGIYDPPPAWLAPVAHRVRTSGALVVADEVQYGLGRSGSHCWGFERRGLVPDIVTLGKPVGNGFPLGVVVAPRAIVEAFQGRQGFFSTFGGNAVAAAAGLAVLEVLDREGLQANAAATGRRLRAGLESLAARHAGIGDIRGAGLLLGVEIVAPAQRGTPDTREAAALARRLVNILAERHAVLTGLEGPRGNVLKLRPPLAFRPAHAEMLVAAIDDGLAAIGA